MPGRAGSLRSTGRTDLKGKASLYRFVPYTVCQEVGGHGPPHPPRRHGSVVGAMPLHRRCIGGNRCNVVTSHPTAITRLPVARPLHQADRGGLKTTVLKLTDGVNLEAAEAGNNRIDRRCGVSRILEITTR